MSRNVISKALLPHRDTISTMLLLHVYRGGNFTYPEKKKACRASQNKGKTAAFRGVMF
jgi:hypothetical protein